MKKKLIIVESPTKAKTIKNFLAKDYEVIASKGHIRDLPKTVFGITLEDGKLIPKYVVSKEHKAIVKEIKELAKKAELIYLATDEDREGEAIAFHIANAIGKDVETLPRIVFHEITKTAIENSLKNPRTIDMNSVNAQQTRRMLDRIVGYKLSPLLNNKIQKGLSAGRVQSVALKILVDREREISSFKPVKYYEIASLFKKNLPATLMEFKGEKIEKLSISSKALAEEILKSIKKDDFIIESISKKERTINPNPPFMTSTLQQSASTALNFSPKKTMMLAQKLYEGIETNKGLVGLITYMRTDSLNISQEALEETRKFISENFEEEYLPKEANIYKNSSKGAQEAHEAIRVTDITLTPELAKNYLSNDEAKLYDLIYKRFLASQMTPSLSQNQSVILKNDEATLKLNGRKLLFDGFYKVFGDLDKDKILPEMKEGKKLKIQSVEILEKETEAPARYSEASIIKKLDSLGIGRPSTYAPTISLLTARKYVKVEKKQLFVSELAMKVTEVLEEHFKNIVDVSFTSNMEKELDDIALEKANWQDVLSSFYFDFLKEIEEGKKNIKSQKTIQLLDEKCPECGGDLGIRKGRFGDFIACLSFPKCRYSRSLENAEEKKVEKKVNLVGIKCPLCKDGDVVERSSKRGKFYACSNYPKCKFASTYKPTEELCPKCGESFLVKKELKKGNFLACPKCKYQEAIK